MLWIKEGFVLDDAGNMLTTSYIDLRDEGERAAIQSLVKGCRREHAVEDGETVLISKPERFREYGVALIRDEQEGFAKEERVMLEAETICSPFPTESQTGTSIPSFPQVAHPKWAAWDIVDAFDDLSEDLNT